MNYRFRKKPVEIEAFQMTKERRQDNRDWPEWLNRAWNKNRHAKGAVWPIMAEDGSQGITDSVSIAYLNSVYELGKDPLCIETLEGRVVCQFDDWIIKGIQGELYPCKPDIFKATYEEVE